MSFSGLEEVGVHSVFASNWLTSTFSGWKGVSGSFSRDAVLGALRELQQKVCQHVKESNNIQALILFLAQRLFQANSFLEFCRLGKLLRGPDPELTYSWGNFDRWVRPPEYHSPNITKKLSPSGFSKELDDTW